MLLFAQIGENMDHPSAMNPKRLDGAERKQQILVCASRMFATCGFDGVSMRNLAKACRCNEALLYKHFPNKHDLFHEVIKGTQEKISAGWENISRNAENGLDGLRGIVGTILNGSPEGLHMYAFMIHAMAASLRDAQFKTLIKTGFGQQLAAFSSMMDRGLGDGSITRAINTERCALCILIRSHAISVIDAISPNEPCVKMISDDSCDRVLGCLVNGSETVCEPTDSLIHGSLFRSEN